MQEDCISLKIKYYPVSGLPKLAWLACLDQNAFAELSVFHGSSVDCRETWMVEGVWDGDVMPCCMDPLRKLKIGNVNQSSLEELWNGPLLAEMRRIHLQEKYNEIPSLQRL